MNTGQQSNLIATSDDELVNGSVTYNEEVAQAKYRLTDLQSVRPWLRIRRHFEATPRNRVGWRSAALTAVLAVCAAALVIIDSGGERSPWNGPFPLPTVTVWRDHDRLMQWTPPPSIEAMAAGTTTSWTIPTMARGVDITASARATGVVKLAVHVPRQLGATSVTFQLPLEVGERIVGLGERFAALNLRGRIWDNMVVDQAPRPGMRSTYSPAPFLLASTGYGLSLDPAEPIVFDVGATRSDRLEIAVGASDAQVELMTGPSPEDILRRQASVVGLPPLPPAWALGVWKNLIGGTDRVITDAARLHAADVPMDAVWIYDARDSQSRFGWRWPIYDQIPAGDYPNVAALVDHFHNTKKKVLGYLAPFIYQGTMDFAYAEAHGYLVRASNGRPLLEEWGGTMRSHVDFTNPAAATWWAQNVAFTLTDLGFDGAMQDYGEEAPLDGYYSNGVTAIIEHNRYPLRYAQAVDTAVTLAKPGAAVFFARSGGLGTQHYATGRFTGDQVRSWNPERGIAAALHAMLSGSVSGWPYWGPDIAGFLQDDKTDHERELWTRWVQLGAMSPTMRDMLGDFHHAVDALTDDRTLAVFRAYARLHTALRPYLYGLAVRAHETGLPIIRPLFLEAPRDPVAWSIDDEYLLGNDILVAPVLRQGETTRQLYLPAGTWRDYWTGISYQGNHWINVPAPVDHIPLLIRAGVDLGLPDSATLWRSPNTVTS